MMTPTWWQLLLLALAAFRATRLVGWDDLTVKPRRWLTGLGDQEHHLWAEWVDAMADRDPSEWSGPTPTSLPISEARFYLSRMIRCPWCAGWWVSLLAWTAFQVWPHGTLVATTPLAISAVVGLVAKNLDE